MILLIFQNHKEAKVILPSQFNSYLNSLDTFYVIFLLSFWDKKLEIAISLFLLNKKTMKDTIHCFSNPYFT